MADYDYSQDLASVGDNILTVISQTAQQVIEQEVIVEEAETDLKAKQGVLKELKEKTLPLIMEEAGQTKVTTSNGLVVEVKEIIRANIPEARRPEGFAWLEEHGQGSLVKFELSVEAGKGEEAAAKLKQISDFCLSLGLQPDIKRSVHAGSLSATVRELLADGQDVDQELLGVFRQVSAEVKPVKVKDITKKIKAR